MTSEPLLPRLRKYSLAEESMSLEVQRKDILGHNRSNVGCIWRLFVCSGRFLLLDVYLGSDCPRLCCLVYAGTQGVSEGVKCNNLTQSRIYLPSRLPCAVTTSNFASVSPASKLSTLYDLRSYHALPATGGRIFYSEISVTANHNSIPDEWNMTGIMLAGRRRPA